MEKDLPLKLPKIRPSLRKTLSVPASSDEKKLQNVDFDVQNRKHLTKSWTHERSIHWKSAQVSLVTDERRASGSFGRRLNVLESSLKTNRTSDHDQTFQSDHERKFTLPLRKYNSEPYLQQGNNPFTVQAKSLKLNHRARDKNTNGEKTILSGLLPSVFFDTRIVDDNLNDEQRGDISKDKELRKIKRKNQRNVSTKERGSSHSQTSKEPQYNHKSHQEITESVIDQDVDNSTRKPLKVLPKRRLSEQIDAYEINRSKDHGVPRRITIRTSKSCPIIVIHECGDRDETTEDVYLVDNGNVCDDSQSKEMASGQMNGCKSLNNDTTSFVSCWKPRESVANRK